VPLAQAGFRCAYVQQKDVLLPSASVSPVTVQWLASRLQGFTGGPGPPSHNSPPSVTPPARAAAM
jgi:hypothetical protein